MYVVFQNNKNFKKLKDIIIFQWYEIIYGKKLIQNIYCRHLKGSSFIQNI